MRIWDPLTPATPSYIGLTLTRSASPLEPPSEFANTQYNYETVLGRWTPALRHGGTGDVISISRNEPSTWDTRRWSQVALFASGWTNWGNILRPYKKQKKVHIMNKSRHSRPDPSYWNVAFLFCFRNGHRTLI